MSRKKYDGYRSYSYLKEGEDYQVIPLAKEIDRVPSAKVELSAAPHTTLTQKHPKHSLESVMEHVAYCVDLIGVDHVGLGPDTLFGDHLGLHHAFAVQLSLAAIRDSGPSYTQVPYVDGMENPGEAMRNAVRWLVKHGVHRHRHREDCRRERAARAQGDLGPLAPPVDDHSTVSLTNAATKTLLRSEGQQSPYMRPVDALSFLADHR